MKDYNKIHSWCYTKACFCLVRWEIVSRSFCSYKNVATLRLPKTWHAGGYELSKCQACKWKLPGLSTHFLNCSCFVRVVCASKCHGLLCLCHVLDRYYKAWQFMLTNTGLRFHKTALNKFIDSEFPDMGLHVLCFLFCYWDLVPVSFFNGLFLLALLLKASIHAW